MAGKISVALVDREGNKKVVSVGVDDPTQALADEFATGLAAQTGAKELSSSFAGGDLILDDSFEQGEFDTVGHVASMRFVGERGAFRFGVPAPIDAFDEEEEVLPAFAAATKAYLDSLKGETLQYRGGSLVSKKVSQPLKMPDLEGEEA